MHAALTPSALMAAAYLAGSVNFAILLFRWTGREDPRRHYSGNPGVTNVYRQAGMLWAAGVLALDMARSMAVAYAGLRLLEEFWLPWLAMALLIGNRFPCLHRFKGGKGVANYLGFAAVIAPWSALTGGLAWLAALALWRLPFLASFTLVAVLSAGMAMRCGHWWLPLAGVAATALLIVFNHRANIKELFDLTRATKH